MRGAAVLFAMLVLLVGGGAAAQSVDVAVAGYGLSLGNSSRFTGLRINAVDRQVERIDGLNVTLWNPGDNPVAEYNGIALGIIGTKGRKFRGVAIGGVGVNARDHLGGVAAGTLGVGARSLTGVGVGLVMVDVHERLRGASVAGIWTGNNRQHLDGLTVAGGGAMAGTVRGAAIGGVFAASEVSLTGVALSPGAVYSGRLRGLAVGGIGAGAMDLDGIAIALGGIGGERLDGVMLAGLGVGASDRIRGIAVGGALVFAPEVTGVAAGALNGLYIDRIDLEDFLHFRLANERFTGLSIGLVNYTARLKGVQIGLINYAGNNPRWLRLLPLLNMHL